MVTIKGGGETYQIGNGKKMSWEEVPQSFKKELVNQREEPKCTEMKLEAQQCVEERGFWATECVELRESFELCQSQQLQQRFLPDKETADAQAAIDAGGAQSISGYWQLYKREAANFAKEAKAAVLGGANGEGQK